MKATDLSIEGLKLVELSLYKDNRGYFVERFNQKRFQEFGLPSSFVQDNHSLSAPGVLRGLHYQRDPVQGKLVGVTRGRIWDVALDLRVNSPTFKKYFSIELNAENGKLLWIPPGFAHGFCVLGSEAADVLYKVDALYNAKGENGILWNDSDIKIPWPIESPQVSERDCSLLSLKEYQKDPWF